MLCLASVALAQRFVSYKQYVTFNAGIGMNGYVSKLSDQGTNDVNGGLMARLGYHYVRRACGVFGGLMLQSYNTNTKLNFMQEIEGAIDQDNMPYIHRTYFHGLEENQRQLSLSIPVEFVYRIYLFGGMRLMLGVGPMFQLSMKNSYRITSGEIETRLYYPEWDLEVFGDHPEHNLYSKTGFNGNYSLRGVPGAVFDASII